MKLLSHAILSYDITALMEVLTEFFLGWEASRCEVKKSWSVDAPWRSHAPSSHQGCFSVVYGVPVQFKSFWNFSVHFRRRPYFRSFLCRMDAGPADFWRQLKQCTSTASTQRGIVKLFAESQNGGNIFKISWIYNIYNIYIYIYGLIQHRISDTYDLSELDI